MRQVICSQCRESFQAPDDLAQAHCVRCGQLIAIETNITTHVDHLAAYQERAPEDARRASGELPDQYGSWEEMRDLSPALQRELMVLAGRPLPDLRKVPARPVPDDVPDEIDEWGRPLGSIDIPGESQPATEIASWVFMGAGLLATVGMAISGIGLGGTDYGPLFFGIVILAFGLWMRFIREPTPLPASIWVFEGGVLVCRFGRARACRWDDIQNFETSNETGRPLFWLTLEHDFTVIISQGHAPQVIPLMEYVEIRMSASQLISRMQAICSGRKERFGALVLDREGIQGPNFFARWPDIRRVFSDARLLFIDWTQQPEIVTVRYSDVSFPYLVMAIANVMIDEHKRLAQVDG